MNKDIKSVFVEIDKDKIICAEVALQNEISDTERVYHTVDNDDSHVKAIRVYDNDDIDDELLVDGNGEVTSVEVKHMRDRNDAYEQYIYGLSYDDSDKKIRITGDNEARVSTDSSTKLRVNDCEIEGTGNQDDNWEWDIIDHGSVSNITFDSEAADKLGLNQFVVVGCEEPINKIEIFEPVL